MRKLSSMKDTTLMKILFTVVLTVSMACAAAGCSFRKEFYIGTNGSANFNINGNHVEMTNFAFDVDPSLEVTPTIIKQDLVYARVLSFDDDRNVIQNISDGKYCEKITKDNVVKVFNTLFQKIMFEIDTPVSSESVSEDHGVFSANVPLYDGDLFLLARADSNEFISLAFSTSEYGSEEIFNAAFDALSLKEE